MYHHKYSLDDLENMLCFERLIYVDMIKEEVRKEKERYEKSINESKNN